MDEIDDNSDILPDDRILEEIWDDITDTNDVQNDDIHLSIYHTSLPETKSAVSCMELQAESPSESSRPSESPNLIELMDVYNANQCLIASYKVAEAAVQQKLNDCRKKKAEVTYQLHLIDRGGQANWKIPYIKAGMPYFKDEKLFPAPKNQDTLKKKKFGELPIAYESRPRAWSTKARNILNRSVRDHAGAKVLQQMKRSAENIERGVKSKQLVPKNWSKYGKQGPSEIDWLKIATSDLKSRYSWKVCWAMWNLQLNDDINHTIWTNKESNKMLEIAEAFNYQDWDSIATALGTKRSAYQCFIRYGTLRPLSSKRAIETPWTTVDNEILSYCVNYLRKGDCIPWGSVASYIENRTKSQVYAHWKYNLRALRKGRFTVAEDKTILNGVAKFGTNFSRIAFELLQDRTSVQISNRYHLLKLKADEHYNSFTIGEDRRIVSLRDKYNFTWKQIEEIMKKDRTYVRHRYLALKRRMQKGEKLVDIQRKAIPDYQRPDFEDVSDEDDDFDMENNVDIQLMKYFQNVQAPVSRPGRRSKYHTADQLEKTTKQLVNIFKILEAQFKVPENLDNLYISEKDKQVLVSLETFMNPNIPRISLDEIEKVRKRMFENNKNITTDDNTEHFCPSASFGFVRKRKRQKVHKNSNGEIIIDLPINVEIPKHSISVNYEINIETPTNVLERINEEEKDIFDKLTSLIIKQTNDVVISGRFEQKFVGSVDFTAGPSVLEKNIVTNTEIDNYYIEPCYATLLGYKCLLNMKNMDKALQLKESESSEHGPISTAGEKAFRLFKSRFFRLFKYPIGLARILDKPIPNSCTPSEHEDMNESDDEY